MIYVIGSEILDVVSEIYDAISSLLPNIQGLFDFVPSFMFPLVSVYLVVCVVYLILGRG